MNTIIIIFIVFVGAVHSTLIINGHDVVTRGKDIYNGNGGDNVLIEGNTNLIYGPGTVIMNNQIKNHSITIKNGTINCGGSFLCPKNSFTCTISRHAILNNSVIVTKQSCCDKEGKIDKSIVNHFLNANIKHVFDQDFALASRNGTVWSCRKCNVTNLAEANQQIAKGREMAKELSEQLKSISTEVSSELNILNSISSQVSSIESSDSSTGTSTSKSSNSEENGSNTSGHKKRTEESKKTKSSTTASSTAASSTVASGTTASTAGSTKAAN